MAANIHLLELGNRVFWDLGQEFVATVFGTTRAVQSSVVCGVPAGAEGDVLTTRFFLDPFASGECAGVDLVVLAIMVVMVHAISWLPRWTVYEPLANWRMNGFKTWDASECRKFSQTSTSLLFFCTSAFFVGRILLPKEWLFSRQGWDGLSHSEVIDADFKFYYLLYMARFLSDLISIFFEDRKRDAFVAAFIHHLVTLGLVIGSAHIGHFGYGGVIMFFFDWADVPLLAAKLCKYLSKDPKDMFQFVANRLFEAFAVCFFLTRNGYFNYVVYCVISDLPPCFVNYYCKVLLVALIVLQTYWFWLIVKAVIRQRENGGAVEDVREKEE